MTTLKYCNCGKLAETNFNHSTNPNHWGLCKDCFKWVEHPSDIYYLGFRLRIKPLRTDSAERPSIESQLCGYRGEVWMSDGKGGWTKRRNAYLEADSLEALESLFENGADAIIDSL